MTDITPGSCFDVLNKWILASGMPILCDLEKSKGAYLYDARSGTEYLDMFSFFASRPLGFNHPKLSEPAFLQRVGHATVHKPSNCDIYTQQYSDFVDKFASVALEDQFAHVFFIEGGSPAVENALKAAIDWKHHKNIDAGRGEKGSKIIHFAQCFHGRTGYCLSLTDSPDPRKTRYFPKFDWPRISNPFMRFPFDEAARTEVEELEARSLAQIDAAFENNPDDIAAMIIEPIQGEGGDNYFRPEFMSALRKICDEREALLIFDEVQTGFGGTGKWWDWQNLGVKPDLMVFGKKVGVCGFAATDRIDEVEGVFKVASRISSTFEGNLGDMVRCTRVIEIIEEDSLIENSRVIGEYMLKMLGEVSDHTGEISNVRGRGLWAAFDMPGTEERDNLINACFEELLIVLPCGGRSVRLRPALDVRADSIGRAGAQLEAALRRAYGRK